MCCELPVLPAGVKEIHMEVMVSSAAPSAAEQPPAKQRKRIAKRPAAEQGSVKKQRTPSSNVPGENTLQRAGKAAVARSAGDADMIILDDEDDDDSKSTASI